VLRCLFSVGLGFVISQGFRARFAKREGKEEGKKERERSTTREGGFVKNCAEISKLGQHVQEVYFRDLGHELHLLSAA